MLAKLLGGMVAFAIFFIRKEAANKAKIAQSLGLTPVTDTQPLLQKIAYVNGINRSGLYRLEQVFHHRHASGEDAYMFSLRRSNFNEKGVNRGNRPTGSHQMTLEASALAFVSPAWRLPRFSTLPRLSGGKLAEIGNNLSETAANIKYEVVNFPHIPNLDERYLIITSEPLASQVNLPDGFLRVLASNPNLRLHAGGDILTLSYADSNSQTPGEEKMKRLYKIGMELAQELER